ncbi:MAG: tetratricopeptide repeat protein [Clostridiales bacterium]|nr:tetratricopeptide repeat protein [Clostridiales bacterium]MDD7036043.1 tetratricopeptide repeat protein [Bacillota bacterium]MDY2920871.1 tetratricopeptide repeat protein [Lentihominibacter sp.]
MSLKNRKKQQENIIHDKEDMSLLQAMGVTRTVVRPREECDIQLREDRIGRYFKKYLNKFVFVEFSPEFMEKNKAGSLMKDVPIPLRRKEVKEFAGGEGIDFLVIAENMAWVMGCDPHFKYTKNYVEILKKLYNYKLYEGMLKEGRDAAENGEMDNACIHFRAALCMRYDYLHAMYSYARACRVMYEHSKNEEYVGRFKAEATDWFELLTETHPRFSMGYYYLGYSYLNMGLYGKAKLAWQGFLKFSKNSKDKKEIEKRLNQIAHPVAIEDGCLKVDCGRVEEGVEILEPYLQSQYNNWWPLHYYLGRGYAQLGNVKEAVTEFKKVLQINGSHIETMKELLLIYEAQDDKANIKKYSEKIKLIETAQEEEQARQIAEIEKENKRLETEEPAPIDDPESFAVTEPDEGGEEARSGAGSKGRKVTKRLGKKQ